MRPGTGQGRRDQSNGEWVRPDRWRDRGVRDQRFSSQGAARSSKRLGGGGARHPLPAGHQSPWIHQGFQEMTAQQNLLGTLEQQLQQAVTRAILQALSGAIPTLGQGQGRGSVPPSC